MAFLLRVLVAKPELGPIMDHLLKADGVTLLDCGLAPLAPATPKMITSRKGKKTNADTLRDILARAVEIGAEFAPRTVSKVSKMPKGSFYGALEKLVQKGEVSRVRDGIYKRERAK